MVIAGTSYNGQPLNFYSIHRLSLLDGHFDPTSEQSGLHFEKYEFCGLCRWFHVGHLDPAGGVGGVHVFVCLVHALIQLSGYNLQVTWSMCFVSFETLLFKFHYINLLILCQLESGLSRLLW